MEVFDFEFVVEAPRSAVAAFHHDARALRRLTPPPMWVQLHEVEPMGEGSMADFTLWLGPMPIRWVARHTGVGSDGFTDTQVRGPMKRWVHTHRFEALGPDRTLVREHIEYEHPEGARGLWTRALFAQVGLKGLFTYRKMVTRRGVQAGA